MEPEIAPGDVVVFDQGRLSPADGEMVVVTNAERAYLTVKRAYHVNGGILLAGNNGRESGIEGFEIAGVVVLVNKLPQIKPRE